MEEINLNNKLLLNERLENAKKQFDLIKELNPKDSQKLEILKQLVSKIEIIPEINFEFLKSLQVQNITYEENGETWNYETNFNMLKETLTSSQYRELTNEIPENPLRELINLLKKIIVTDEKDYSKLLKDKINYILNFPLIDGIERLRLYYYKNYILNTNTFKNIKNLKDYIINIEKDKDICDINIDENKFGLKIYFLILYISDLMNVELIFIANAYFLNDLGLSKLSFFKDELKMGNILIKRNNGKLYINNGYEETTIGKEDYLFDFLIKDIMIYQSYPLKILLFRNESFLRFKKYGVFIKQINLYDKFIKYIKYFIKSNCIQEILNQSEYKYIKELINNDSYLDNIFTDKYLKFLPFFGVTTFFGFTNKDILVSTINSIPEISTLIPCETQEIYTQLYYISLLLSICVKFITVIHEILINLTTGYINYYTEKRVSSNSPKTSLNLSDGGNAFEEKLTGVDKFHTLTLQSVIALLDGVTCQKKLKEFQQELKKPTNIEEIINKKSNGLFKGFLEDFFKIYNINFTVFKNLKTVENINVKCRSINEIFISMERSRELRTCSGGRK